MNVANEYSIIDLSINLSDWSLSVSISWIFGLFVAAALATGYLIFQQKRGAFKIKDFIIDEAELGVGKQKIKLKPNLTDKQIAYEIWVELSTRKIGLKIDLEHDIIIEVYDSWYAFFGITRNLIRSIDIIKLGDPSTEKIVSLSIDILNEGVRPHLTKWQSRYRYWLKKELEKEDAEDTSIQDIQKRFPGYEELTKDLLRVNKNLIAYRKKLHEMLG